MLMLSARWDRNDYDMLHASVRTMVKGYKILSSSAKCQKSNSLN